MIEIRSTSPHEPQMRALLEASHRLYEELFPPEDNHYLSLEALAGPDVRFWGAFEGTEGLGCGALALREGYGEIKSMFTAPSARGRGIAQLLLRRLEDNARALGLQKICLETGDVLYDAHRLYARAGFRPCGPFGAYQAAGSSVFMEKDLS